MTRWVMTIDLDRCTGCQACVVACQVENNVAPPTADDAARGRNISWLRLVVLEEDEPGDERRLPLAPVPCQHCDRPPCAAVCPVGATQRNDDGLVGQVYPRCIGCRYCTTACPYTVRQFNWHRPEFPSPLDEGLNPDVSVRPVGVVEKCTFCHHRIQRALDQARHEKRALRDGEVVPACVQTCPAEAMAFGDLDDHNSEVARVHDSPRAFRLLEDLGTEPKVIYLRKGE